MASYHIGTANSRIYTVGNPFFDNGTQTPNSLIIDQNAFLIAQSAEAISVGSQNWTIVVDGAALGDPITAKAAIFLWSTLATSFSSVTIGTEGAVEGAFGVFAEHRTNVVNHGVIDASGSPDSSGIVLIDTADGNSSVVNSGTIDSNRYL